MSSIIYIFVRFFCGLSPKPHFPLTNSYLVSGILHWASSIGYHFTRYEFPTTHQSPLTRCARIHAGGVEKSGSKSAHFGQFLVIFCAFFTTFFLPVLPKPRKPTCQTSFFTQKPTSSPEKPVKNCNFSPNSGQISVCNCFSLRKKTWLKKSLAQVQASSFWVLFLPRRWIRRFCSAIRLADCGLPDGRELSTAADF